MKFRFLPVLTVVMLGLGLPWLAAELVDFARHYSHLVPAIADKLAWLYAKQGVQLVLALSAIAAMKWLVPADYGLHLPRGRSYAGAALLWGLSFGVLMTVVDYLPNIVLHTAPKLSYPLTTTNAAGWLGFEGVYLGPTEEVLFRSLLVTYLAVTMPGRVHWRGLEMNAAGIVVAAIFAITPVANSLNLPLWMILGQVISAFVLGVLAAYWLEKSKSVLAPVIGHNMRYGTEYVLVLLMIAFWA